MLDLNSYLGISAKALSIRDQRSSILANNLANTNTPNFKAQDIDFNEYLSNSMANDTPLKTTSSNQFSGQADFTSSLKYRVPTELSLDGNTVDKDLETTEFAKNAMGYQASLSFLNNKIRNMMMALRGE
jgi:flagellar basal-body rod protein FlgB